MLKWTALAVCLPLTSCATSTNKSIRHYIEPLNQASQDEVAQHIGRPQLVRNLEGGETVWTYRSNPKLDDSKSCQEYHLTFGANRILKNWVRQSC